MPRPKCKQCDKPLAKVWYRVNFATERFGREPYETRPQTYSRELEGHYGHYGKDADGRFCTYRCGYLQAVKDAGGRTFYSPGYVNSK